MAGVDTVKKNKLLQNTLDTTLEISKLLKFSLRRYAMFSTLESQLSQGFELDELLGVAPLKAFLRTALSLECYGGSQGNIQ